MFVGVGVCELIRLVVRRGQLRHVAGAIVVIAFVAAGVVLGAYEVAVIVIGVARAALIDVYLDTVEVCTVGVLVVAATQVHIVHNLITRVFHADRAGGVLPACGVVRVKANILVARIAAVCEVEADTDRKLAGLGVADWHGFRLGVAAYAQEHFTCGAVYVYLLDKALVRCALALHVEVSAVGAAGVVFVAGGAVDGLPHGRGGVLKSAVLHEVICAHGCTVFKLGAVYPYIIRTAVYIPHSEARCSVSKLLPAALKRADRRLPICSRGIIQCFVRRR